MSRYRILGFSRGLLVVAALVGGTVISSVAAATPRGAGRRRPRPRQPPHRGTCRRRRRRGLRRRSGRPFAANLGVAEAALAPAAKPAALATVDQAVSRREAHHGRRRPAQGTDRGRRADGCQRLAGASRPRRGRALGVRHATRVTAAADALGMTPADLGAQLGRAPRSRTIATDKGVPYGPVTAAVLAPVKGDLDAAVAAGTIKQARADRILARLTGEPRRRPVPRAEAALGRAGAPTPPAADAVSRRRSTWRCSPSPRMPSKASSRSSSPIRRSMSRSIGSRPVEVERGVAREVDGRVGEPVVRAEDPPAAIDERVDLERGPRAERRHADEDRGAAERQALDRELDRRAAARSPRRRSRDRRRSGRAAPRSVVGRRRRRGGRPWPRPRAATASLAGTRSIATIRAAPASAAPMTHDRPTPPSPMTATLAPGSDRGGLEDRPDAGRHAAADERGHRRVDAVGEGDRGRRRYDGRLGHRRDRAVRRGPAPRASAADGTGPCRRAAGAGTTASRGRPTVVRSGTPGRCRTG